MQKLIFNEVEKRKKVRLWLKILEGYKKIKTVCMIFFAHLWQQAR